LPCGVRVKDCSVRNCAVRCSFNFAAVRDVYHGVDLWAKVGRIVYGAGRDDVHEMYFEDRHLSTENFVRDALRTTSPWRGDFGAGMRCALRTTRSGCARGSAVQSLIVIYRPDRSSTGRRFPLRPSGHPDRGNRGSILREAEPARSQC
jgi:hypothetical protein